MKAKAIISISLIYLFCITCSKDSNEIKQVVKYPSFGPEKDVNIVGLSFDAMEPFISADGNYLFFNNLNDGINTKLFYATRIDDSTFTYIGELAGSNQITIPHLDAVADMDSYSNFYWTSTRAYPNELDNLFRGTFNSGGVFNIARVQGDFYMNTSGWLVMDHSISLNGEYLYFNNARIESQNCQGVCETFIGVARKLDTTTFNKLPNSNQILETINNANYIYYAPCISADNLEFYYTRYLKGTITPSTKFEICVAVRKDSLDNFSDPKVLFSETILNLIEAPSLTVDKRVLYYHKKVGNSYKIVMRNRI